MRDGVVDEVALEIDPPFGALPGSTFHAQDLPLRNDATVMCVDWHGGPRREREPGDDFAEPAQS